MDVLLETGLALVQLFFIGIGFIVAWAIFILPLAILVGKMMANQYKGESYSATMEGWQI